MTDQTLGDGTFVGLFAGHLTAHTPRKRARGIVAMRLTISDVDEDAPTVDVDVNIADLDRLIRVLIARSGRTDLELGTRTAEEAAADGGRP